MYTLLDGRKISKEIKSDLKIKVEQLKEIGVTPGLAVILVGQDSASKIYVNLKSKSCIELGIYYEEYFLDENISEEKLLNLIDELNKKDIINGILVQSPLPKHINENKVFQKISSKKDVDGFNPINAGKLFLGQDGFVPCTPFGIMKLLKSYDINIEGKHAVVIGRSNIVGKPMAHLLLDENATVTVCHSRTKNLKHITANADILIVAIGKGNFVTSDMIKKDAIVVDVGITRDKSGKIFGDVDFENVKDKTSYITSVPGGVGPMTIAMLMYNVIQSAKIKII